MDDESTRKSKGMVENIFNIWYEVISRTRKGIFHEFISEDYKESVKVARQFDCGMDIAIIEIIAPKTASRAYVVQNLAELDHHEIEKHRWRTINLNA